MKGEQKKAGEAAPSTGKGAARKLREVPIAWEALEDAFENNAHEVHSYLHLETGEVIRVVDGVADPSMHGRIMADPLYLRIDPVSSREQYRWMERFIATVDESDLRQQLLASIDGKGAFRRFKDVLMSFPVDRERWFTFRSERLRFCMESWLTAHGIEPVERPQWRVPTADEVKAQVELTDQHESPARKTRAAIVEVQRKKVHDLADALPARELDAAIAFLEFLRERRHLPRPQSKLLDRSGGEQAEGASEPPEGHEDEHDEGSNESAEGAKLEKRRAEESREASR
jgi:hypothetical protein